MTGTGTLTQTQTQMQTQKTGVTTIALLVLRTGELKRGIWSYFWYGKCPKILYTKVTDKMAYANSIDPDQTAPEGAV